MPQYVIYGGHRYFYLTNLQGDVVAIVNTSGETVVEYSYDAWGNILPTTGTMAGTLGKDNPLRYRGYVYDNETGLYYLQSRYYDPSLGRFINADGYTSTGQGLLGNNMFAYCGNNPVNRVDFMGLSWNSILDFVKTVATEISKAMRFLAPAYAGCGGVAVADGPLFAGDLIGLAGAALLTVGVTGYGIYQATQATSIFSSKAEEKVDAVTIQPSSSTVIYRYGGTSPSNLTPRAKDRYTGLSFSTVPKPNAAVTTIEALNETGLVRAIKDGPTHVSVRPIGATMDDWINAGSSSIWTQAVKSVVVKWDGGY